MISLKKSIDYVKTGTLFSSEDMEVYVGFKKENRPENLHILNKFPYSEKKLDIFKKLFFLYGGKEKPEEFVDFFVFEDDFYAVFKYAQAETILQKYDKRLNTATFKERCDVLEDILLKIERIYKIDRSVLACVTSPENILVDLDSKMHLNFNLKDIFKNEKAHQKEFFANLRDIIFTVLRPEAEYKYNKDLHIVIDKCSRNVYVSMPEMMVELSRAQRSCGSANFLSYLKYQLSIRNKMVKKITTNLITLCIIIGLGYWGYSQMNQLNRPLDVAPAVSIGDVTYNAKSEDDASKEISTEKTTPINKAKAADIILTPGLDMAYEDHIVQYGDKISTICDDYYKDSKYISAVATFNNLQANDRLDPGSILKLPNRTAIALYLSQ